MLILVPYNYPMAAPKVRFLTRVCHPNVNLKVRPRARRATGGAGGMT